MSHHELYGPDYAQVYIERTLNSPYTVRKNTVLAETARHLGAENVLDAGCNVNAIVNRPGSLRYQMEKQGIQYLGIDVSEAYFNREGSGIKNVPEHEQFGEVRGVVGDVMQLPVRDAAMDAVVCADVLEHVPDPSRAFTELSRVLAPNGSVLIVLPSLYKLDVADFEYIETKRHSSHESKLAIKDWERMWEEAGLTLNTEHSRPIGIASGLSYLSWLDEAVVPERHAIGDEEHYSARSQIHKKAKGILAKYDGVIDEVILNNPALSGEMTQQLQNGDIQGIFFKLREITETLEISPQETDALDDFFIATLTSLDTPSVAARLQELQATFRNHKNPLLSIGNSAFLVLNKQ